MSRWQVHKFGGTSLANASCFKRVSDIIWDLIQGGAIASTNDDDGNIEETKKEKKQRQIQLCVVVSAMGGKPKTTDLLLQAVEAAANRELDKTEELLEFVYEKHTNCLQELFPSCTSSLNELKKVISEDLKNIKDILKTVSLMKWQASRIRELVSGYGELWSAQILTALMIYQHQQRQLQQQQEQQETQLFKYLDARNIIIIDEDAIQDGAVVWDICRQNWLQHVQKTKDSNFIQHFIMTGYVASNTQGVPTTLQRDGSDYSAAIAGNLASAQNITIWTDVSGVLSADPRRVPSAHVLNEVSFNEAMELAYFGAKVIHPKTMQPAIMASPPIPIFIRNTFLPRFRGTRIFTSSTTHVDRDRCVCGLSSVEQMALVNVEGSGLVGVPGVAKRLFGSLESAHVNVVLISQASSEHSITLSTLQSQAQIAKQAIEEEFHKEIKQNRISQVDVEAPCSIIAAVGDGMSSTAGVSGRFFSALGNAKINVLAISQGCSERNISAVVHSHESTRALRAIHAAFRLSHTTVRIGLIGMNDIGISLLKLLATQRNKIRQAFEMDLQVCVILQPSSSSEEEENNNDKKKKKKEKDILVCLQKDQDGIDDSLTVSAYNMATGGGEGGQDTAVVDFTNSTDVAKQIVLDDDDDVLINDAFTSHLLSSECAHHVIFDCTGDESVGKCHAKWLRQGIHIVTANNSGLAGSQQQRQEIRQAEMCNGKLSAQYLRGVTVGGALPCIDILKSLLNSGDRIKRIDGILSISWSYIMFRISPPHQAKECMEFDQSILSTGARDESSSIHQHHHKTEACSFRQAVEEAIALGLMEQDPGKDMNNDYCARVMMVLAKELGFDTEITSKAEIQERSQTLFGKDHQMNVDYTDISPEVDRHVQQLVDAAAADGCVLRHVASVDMATKQIDIEIKRVPTSHVFAVTPPSCECVRFFTQRHRRYPLVIQGPSAGADSTASALLAQLLGLMRGKVGPATGQLSRANSSTRLGALA